MSKSNTRNIKKRSAFDTIIEELMHDEASEDLLRDCMTFDVKKLSRIPLRYRIIAIGFIRRYSLEEVNRKLKEEGCAQLYSRSVWESSLIYAFNNGLSYEEWKKLQDTCFAFLHERGVQSGYFKKSSVTVNDLEIYVKESSAKSEELIFRTRHLTQMLEHKLKAAKAGEKNFGEFITGNEEAFSLVREKTRYYFCKYLLFMLQNRIETYINERYSEQRRNYDIEPMVVFRGISQLKRKRMEPDECRTFLKGTPISFGALFDEFNQFFFEYVSLDWMEILLDYYGNIDHLSKEEMAQLSAHLRKYDAEQYQDLTDEKAVERLKEELEKKEALLDEKYSLDASLGKPSESRVGEYTLRKYVKGELDLDRTTLICFLLFFGNNGSLKESDRINRNRLTDILLECGFPGLRDENNFDDFVIRYLEADDRAVYLTEEVTNQAMREENAYLFRVYRDASNYDKAFENLLF